LSSASHSATRPWSKQSDPACDAGEKARLPRSKPSIRLPECSDGASPEEPAAFNAHSPRGTGCGLVQYVFPLPARIQLPSPNAEAYAPRRQAKNAVHYAIYVASGPAAPTTALTCSDRRVSGWPCIRQVRDALAWQPQNVLRVLARSFVVPRRLRGVAKGRQVCGPSILFRM
jgi:hypothetical protein